VLFTKVDGKEVLLKITQTNDLAARSENAEQCSATLKLSLPTVIDKADNKVNTAYAGWPDRLYIVGKDGKIAYKGAQGPGGFKINEMTTELEKLLAKK
jgi:type I thyroxine 5'-deiodinase